MIRNNATGLLILAALLLIGAVGLQFLSVRNLSSGDQRSLRATDWLDSRVPGNLVGWSGKDVSLGASEFMKGQVEEILNFDDCSYRIYSRGSARLGVYVAYWKQDRMPVSRVASHTPDRCWTDNGWSCEAMRFDERWTVSGEKLQPGQWRIFKSPRGDTEYVVFWHLIGDKTFDFGDRFTHFTDPTKWVRDTIAYATLGSAEQYFIRLTSDRPFDELNNDPGFQEILRALGKLGLAEG